jgi:hypothetical protein
MLAPPLDDGAVHETSADVVFETAITEVGAPGTVRGVVDPATDGAPEPIALSARSTTLYDVPLVNPLIENGLDRVPGVVQVAPLSRLYSSCVTGDPPSVPSVNATETSPAPGVTAIDGAAGAAAGATMVVADAGPVPIAVTART